MTNRMLSMGVLLFSFAALLFAFKPAENVWSFHFDEHHFVPIVTMPNLGYWILGAIAIGMSLFFIIMAFRDSWSQRVETFISGVAHYPWFVVFYFVYTMSFLNAVGKIVSIAPPEWIVYLFFYFGFLLFLLIPVICFLELPKLKSRRRLSSKKP